MRATQRPEQPKRGGGEVLPIDQQAAVIGIDEEHVKAVAFVADEPGVVAEHEFGRPIPAQQPRAPFEKISRLVGQAMQHALQGLRNFGFWLWADFSGLATAKLEQVVSLRA